MKIFAERTGRHCLSLPSNRLGLYLALRHWCVPGMRLLMSPISADEILFLVLAAGLRPVIAPLSPRDGNIDASRVNLGQVDAVLTTNLYGLPDNVAAFTGKILIEDVAHAMETDVGGRPLGTFGQAGVFSLSKHPGAGSGGVLVVERKSDLDALTRARDELLTPGSPLDDLMSVTTSMARQVALRLNLVRPALHLMRALGLQEERDGYRIALDPDGLELALKQVPQLPPFDPWVRADLHRYRAHRGGLARWYQGRRVAKVPGERARRVAGVRRLAELPTVAPAVLDDLTRPLFRVPLLVRDRDAAIAELERHGVATGYLYDPPYDDYAPDFTEHSFDPGPARWWARHVLPVDPMYVTRSFPILSRLEPPATRP
ncbi:dTDP-4-amino-4,6-dideoxygalactose transaminase [Nonomuraea solani]|uniref:dTDP-4-amino-4,6-dideoxygalactose transaminase n=1 Tax=Nonomuraea solani TaxID=1144553 RepID=A0A1H6EX36_9ACTN|nr:DegT/DnrJ/EryC1/StrS family aminotransferase [Nonomuraea solani]SEH02480.1 dTDP-4-amino-4,6-dideoxygalactose transaminase [Nonomuraea solani]